MATTFTWTINAMDCYPTHEGQTDVVYTIHYSVSGADGDYTGSSYGTVGVTYDPATPFTPYADLTQDQVIGWVTSALGAEQVAEYEANVSQQIADQANPPVVTPALPWAS
jgi:hypothetical protein